MGWLATKYLLASVALTIGCFAAFGLLVRRCGIELF